MASGAGSKGGFLGSDKSELRKIRKKEEESIEHEESSYSSSDSDGDPSSYPSGRNLRFDLNASSGGY